MVAERAGAAAQALRLEGLQQAANDFWALLCEFSTVPSAARLAQQVGHASAVRLLDCMHAGVQPTSGTCCCHEAGAAGRSGVRLLGCMSTLTP